MEKNFSVKSVKLKKMEKISKRKPPKWILDKVKELWNVNWEDGITFTYGDLITNCYGEIPPDLYIHEKNHTRQQKKDPEKWWKRYFQDPEFRYNQELECYCIQYQWVKNNVKDRNKAYSMLRGYARLLSSPMYGSLKSEMGCLQDIYNNN